MDESSMNPCDDLDALDDSSWSLMFQDIVLHDFQSKANNAHDHHQNPTTTNMMNSSAQEDIDHGTTSLLDKGLTSMRISGTTSSGNYNSKKRKKHINEEEEEEKIIGHNHNLDEEGGPSDANNYKKLDHNAKERIRRMKLNASYLSLRSLLPDQYSKRSKKRWSAPLIVDKVLKYIPELENEIEALKSKKENMQLLSEANNKRIIDANEINPNSQYQSHTISVNKVNQDEAIVQICMANRSQENKNTFTDLLQSLEDDHNEIVFGIKSVSSLDVCESRFCYHLHIQLNQSSSGCDHIEDLRNMLTSCLR